MIARPTADAPPGDGIGVEAERAVIGAALIFDDVVGAAELEPATFEHPRHRLIWRAMRMLHAQGRGVDQLSVRQQLDASGSLQGAGGDEYLIETAQWAGDSAVARAWQMHADTVRERADRRKLRAAIQEVLDANPDADTSARWLREAIEAVGASRSHSQDIDVMFPRDLDGLGERQELVQGLILDDSLTVIAGPPKQYKTTIGDALTIAVADGSEWLGMPVVEPGLVIDFALEGRKGKRSRLLAAVGAERWLDPDDHIHRRVCIPRTLPDLTTVAGVDAVLRCIERVQKLTGERLRLMKIDTLARGMAIAGLDENSTADMGLYIAALDRLRGEFPCAQMLIHHNGHSGRLRGSTALPGAYDLLIQCKKIRPNCARVEFMEARDVDLPGAIEATFSAVHVGTKKSGSPITALRLDTADRSATGEQCEARQEAETAAGRRQWATYVVTEIGKRGGVENVTGARDAITGNDKMIGKGWNYAKAEGWLVNRGTAREPLWKPADSAPTWTGEGAPRYRE